MKIINKKPKKDKIKKIKYQSLEKVIRNTFNEGKSNVSVDAYAVDFNLVNTLDLLRLYRNLTLFNYWTSELKIKEPDADREAYFATLATVIGIKFTELDAESIKNKTFLERIPIIVKQLRDILATRENIPNKKQSKEIRRKKAQGNFIVD